MRLTAIERIGTETVFSLKSVLVKREFKLKPCLIREFGPPREMYSDKY